MTAHCAIESFEGVRVSPARQRRGQRAYRAGVAAEGCIERLYESRGMRIEARRFRGARGEIDLIVRDGAALVFIEVKQSRDFDRAAESLSERQMMRICGAAEEYLAREPQELMTECRFDVALVDARGGTRVLENAFGLF